MSRGPRQRAEVLPVPPPPPLAPAAPRQTAMYGEIFAESSDPITEELDASMIIETPLPTDSTPRASRSVVAGRALDQALPSPKSVMIVLGATGVIALFAAIAALV
jgi:hypothetical protein